ncbi:MAG: DUF4292 domain-containing protein [Flavobacteriaceae bacterium]|jgi:hypothetical protein
MKAKPYSVRLLKMILIGAIFLFASCKSPALPPSRTPMKDIQTKELAQSIAKNKLSYKKFRTRVKTTYDNGKRKQQIIINLRMEKSKSIWMSANMIVPIAKLLITPDKVSFYEKFQKTFFEGDVSFINEQFNTSFEFSDLQNLLMGLPLTDIKKGRWETISHPKFYILTPQSSKTRFRPTFFFDPNSFLLLEQRFMVPGTQQSLTIKYLNHQKLDGEFIPGEVQISLFDGKDLTRINLEYTRADFPDRLSIPFDIPTDYEPIEM